MMSRVAQLAAFAAATQKNSAPTSLSTGQALRRDHDRLARRSAQGFRDDPLIARAMAFYRQMIGNPVPILTGPSEAATKRVKKAWADWAISPGWEHNHGSYATIMLKIAQELVDSGEAFLQRLLVPTKDGRNGLMLQVWPGRKRDRGSIQLGSPRITDGLEYRNGRIVAVWFNARSSAPEEFLGDRTRIPFEDLIWYRNGLYGDQVDGLPPFHAALQTAARLEKAIQTSLVRTQVDAATGGIALARDAAIFGTNIEPGVPRICDANDEKVYEMRAGNLLVAHGVEDVKFNRPSEQAFPHEVVTARTSAGTGLDSELLSGNMGRASFSALRMANLQRHGTIMAFREAVDWPTNQRRLTGWWREEEAVQGRRWTEERYKATFLPPSIQHVDAAKQANADKTNIEIGVDSKTAIILRSGRDPEEVFAEIDAEQNQTPAEDNEQESRHLHAV